MNSRQRRKLAAIEHNERGDLLEQYRSVRVKIATKFGVRPRVLAFTDNSNIRREIARLEGLLEL
jgi:flagellar biosynthesis component FlhA